MTVKTVAEIMTTHLVTLKSNASLQDAHEITREKGIRHLPIIDENSGKLVALLTQKKMVTKVISLLALYGSNALERRERRTPIMDAAEIEFATVAPTTPILDAANYFLSNKHGCLPVVEDDEILGVVTSSDFVRLSAQLLKELQLKSED